MKKLRAEKETSSVILPSPAGDPEWRLLILGSRLELDEARARELQSIIEAGSVDWEALIRISSMHGTIGLLYRNIVALGLEASVPEGIMSRMKETYFAIAAYGMRQLAEFRLFGEAMNEAGVAIMILKGAYLAESLYRDPGLRPLSDIDIIVHEEDWPRIYPVLKEEGFSSLENKDFEAPPPKLARFDVQSHLQFAKDGGACLEFQFDLYTIGLGMVDIDGVWRRAVDAEVNGVPVKVPGPEDNLLHMVVHANRHGCSRLKWLVDIAETLSNNMALDWNLIVEIARREKIDACVYLTLKHVEEVFGERLVNPAAIIALKPTGIQQRAWSYVWPRQELMEFRGRSEDGICFYYYRPWSGWNLVNFALMGRVRDKLALQARWIFPPMAWMEQVYGRKSRKGMIGTYLRRLTDYVREKQ